MSNQPNNRDPITMFMSDHELTVKEFAEQAQVTEQVIRRAVQGLFGKLPPSLAGVMYSYDPSVNWERIYDAFLWAVEIPDLPMEGTSFRDWRYKVSPNLLEFCRLLRVQPVIISNYENGKTQDLPIILRRKLKPELVKFLEGLPHHD